MRSIFRNNLFSCILAAVGSRRLVATSQRCEPTSVEVAQTNTGEQAGTASDPVFEVIVRNLCKCGVQGVFLHAVGFASSIPVDPKLFRREGVGYLVGDGHQIQSNGEVRFRYAWNRAFRMAPVAVQDACA